MGGFNGRDILRFFATLDCHGVPPRNDVDAEGSLTPRNDAGGEGLLTASETQAEGSQVMIAMPNCRLCYRK